MPHRQNPGLGPSLAPPRRPERTLAVALVALIAFNQPMLRIFDQGASSKLAGLPVIYLYIFAAWGLVIALLAAAVETSGKSSRTAEDAPGQELAEPQRRSGQSPPSSGERAET
ncbi:MAG: hypothetical protein JNM89_10705 [Hyphomicrobiaceae bacterium]|nr:hypothetical protein [Hyphomicrobiaceae bacterium]